jgi:hypothetical protein
MSSYFDNKSREVDAVPRESEEAYIAGVAVIERAMIDDVVLVAGDREFPADLREKIMSAIAKWHVGEYPAGLPPQPKAIEYVLSLRMSELVERMHDIFHQVASRRTMTRFGRLSDNPPDILNRRDEYDGERKE